MTKLQYILVCLGIIVGGFACSTVHQQSVEPARPGYYRPDPVPGGFLIGAEFRARYNALVDAYGKKRLENGAPVFLPPLERDDGLRDLGNGQWFMTQQAYENMYVMSRMQARGAAP